jgi:hypothetical protein
MSWRTLTETDLLTALSPDELEKIRAALGGDASDCIAGILSSLADELRGHIAAGGSAIDSTEHTLPQSVIRQAAIIAAVAVATRSGGTMIDPKGMRKIAYEGAIAFFEKRVAEGLFSIEQPTTSTAQTLSNKSATPSFTEKTLTLQRTDQSGI